jgi:hypothetical protein
VFFQYIKICNTLKTSDANFHIYLYLIFTTSLIIKFPMNILILGDASDAHAAHVKDALTQAGAAVDYLDTYLFSQDGFTSCLGRPWTPW